ncbi:hypothetical protein NEMBOFW57_002669 [Staphylotrichum longicolle]|uniref:Dolichyl-diphosphooligosaccharide--protein glycosyltransferase subunit 1 n=1 Tax=Staphylotrichum longicolle TaxID=669026 RepID=A0AAD4F3C0_9PEZI|nr:hypothetical protein NEMBOFW57_002669 [Staphylotrichum longicolle]
MKTTAVFSAFLSLLSLASAAGSDRKSSSSSSSSTSTTLPATFKPPQVFKNTNLVHVISVEKNYVKENINVLVENIDKAAHDEYFVPFTADQMSRLGGVEVKDRKDATAGPFVAEAVEFDQERWVKTEADNCPGSSRLTGHSDVQYLRIRLPKPLAPGAQQTLGISFYLLKAYKPLPASIKQEEPQFLQFSFSAYCPSAYTTAKQKTEVKFPSSTIPDYTKLPGSGEVAEFPQKQGSKLTVRFEFNKPVTHVSRLERDVEVSHWGGNAQYYQPNSFALKEMKFPCAWAAPTLLHGRDRQRLDVALPQQQARGPARDQAAVSVFGGWKYPFTIGWNSDAKNFLRKTATGGNVKFHTTIPTQSITEAGVEIHKTFLDTLGRTALVIKARNLVDDLRDRELVVSYDYPLAATLRKPLIVFGSAVAVFVSAWAVGHLDLKFDARKK